MFPTALGAFFHSVPHSSPLPGMRWTLARAVWLYSGRNPGSRLPHWTTRSSGGQRRYWSMSPDTRTGDGSE
jgi:hypothetical protein